MDQSENYSSNPRIENGVKTIGEISSMARLHVQVFWSFEILMAVS